MSSTVAQPVHGGGEAEEWSRYLAGSAQEDTETDKQLPPAFQTTAFKEEEKEEEQNIVHHTPRMTSSPPTHDVLTLTTLSATDAPSSTHPHSQPTTSPPPSYDLTHEFVQALSKLSPAYLSEPIFEWTRESDVVGSAHWASSCPLSTNEHDLYVSSPRLVSFDLFNNRLIYQPPPAEPQGAGGGGGFFVVDCQKTGTARDGIFVTWEKPACESILFSPDGGYFAYILRDRKSVGIAAVLNAIEIDIPVPVNSLVEDVLGLMWLPAIATDHSELVVVTSQGIAIYKLQHEASPPCLKLTKRFSATAQLAWLHSPTGYAVLAVGPKTLQPYLTFCKHPMKLPKIELNIPKWQAFEQQDVELIHLYDTTYCVHKDAATGRVSMRCLSASLQSDVVLDTRGPGSIDLSVVDNLLIAHRRQRRISLVFDIRPVTSALPASSSLPAPRSVQPLCSKFTLAHVNGTQVTDTASSDGECFHDLHIGGLRLDSPYTEFVCPNIVIDHKGSCVCRVELNIDALMSRIMTERNSLVLATQVLLRRSNCKDRVLALLRRALRRQQPLEELCLVFAVTSMTYRDAIERAPVRKSAGFSKKATVALEALVKSVGSQTVVVEKDMVLDVLYPHVAEYYALPPGKSLFDAAFEVRFAWAASHTSGAPHGSITANAARQQHPRRQHDSDGSGYRGDDSSPIMKEPSSGSDTAGSRGGHGGDNDDRSSHENGKVLNMNNAGQTDTTRTDGINTKSDTVNGTNSSTGTTTNLTTTRTASDLPPNTASSHTTVIPTLATSLSSSASSFSASSPSAPSTFASSSSASCSSSPTSSLPFPSSPLSSLAAGGSCVQRTPGRMAYELSAALEYMRSLMNQQILPHRVLQTFVFDLCLYCNQDELIRQLLQYHVLLDSVDIAQRLSDLWRLTDYPWAQQSCLDMAARLQEWSFVVDIMLLRKQYAKIVPTLRRRRVTSYPLKHVLRAIGENVKAQEADPELLSSVLGAVREWVRDSQSTPQSVAAPNLQDCSLWLPELRGTVHDVGSGGRAGAAPIARTASTGSANISSNSTTTSNATNGTGVHRSDCILTTVNATTACRDTTPNAAGTTAGSLGLTASLHSNIIPPPSSFPVPIFCRAPSRYVSTDSTGRGGAASRRPSPIAHPPPLPLPRLREAAVETPEVFVRAQLLCAAVPPSTDNATHEEGRDEEQDCHRLEAEEVLENLQNEEVLNTPPSPPYEETTSRTTTY